MKKLLLIVLIAGSAILTSCHSKIQLSSEPRVCPMWNTHEVAKIKCAQPNDTL